MGKSKETFKSSDENVKLLVYADGSKAELYLSDEENLINSQLVENFLKEAEITYGFKNAQAYCEENGIKRESGKFFPIAIADDMSWEPQVEIIIEPLECLLSPRLFSLNDLERIRYISVGEKLAKVQAGDNSIQNKNIFGRLIRDLAADKNFLDTYIGENVKFDARRNVIIAEKEGFVLVENGKRISVIDNIFLQQDIIDIEHEIKTGLTLDGSIFNSHLKVGGNLKILGKIDNCDSKGIIALGNIELQEAENSKLICSGDLFFSDTLHNCKVFANGYVQGSEKSTISGGHVQSGRFIKVAVIGDDAGQETVTEISIAPFLKAQMIKISQDLREDEWDNQTLDDTNPLTEELKNLEMLYLKSLPDYISLHREEKMIVSSFNIMPPVKMRIFDISKEIESENEELSFKLVDSI